VEKVRPGEDWKTILLNKENWRQLSWMIKVLKTKYHREEKEVD
jgi:hypothetical protein